MILKLYISLFFSYGIHETVYTAGCCEDNDGKFINIDNLNELGGDSDDGDSDDSVSEDDDDDDNDDDNDDIEVYQLGDGKIELEQVLEIPVSV